MLFRTIISPTKGARLQLYEDQQAVGVPFMPIDVDTTVYEEVYETCSESEKKILSVLLNLSRQVYTRLDYIELRLQNQRYDHECSQVERNKIQKTVEHVSKQLKFGVKEDTTIKELNLPAQDLGDVETAVTPIQNRKRLMGVFESIRGEADLTVDLIADLVDHIISVPLRGRLFYTEGKGQPTPKFENHAYRMGFGCAKVSSNFESLFSEYIAGHGVSNDDHQRLLGKVKSRFNTYKQTFINQRVKALYDRAEYGTQWKLPMMFILDFSVNEGKNLNQTPWPNEHDIDEVNRVLLLYPLIEKEALTTRHLLQYGQTVEEIGRTKVLEACVRKIVKLWVLKGKNSKAAKARLGQGISPPKKKKKRRSSTRKSESDSDEGEESVQPSSQTSTGTRRSLRLMSQ